MITLQTATNVFVGVDGGELYLVAGGWSLTNVSYVQVGTNSQVEVPVLRDGAVVIVDSGGLVSMVDGPDLIGAGVQGFTLAMMTVGLVLGVRYAMRKALAGLSLGSSAD